MSNEIMLWMESGQSRLQEHLVGRWADDIWLVNPKSSKRRAVYLRFSITSIPLKIEIKFAVWSMFDCGQWNMEKDQGDLRRNLIIIIKWLNHFTSTIQSLMERSLEQWEISLRSYIIQTGQRKQRIQKVLLSTQEYLKYVGEDRCIYLFRQLYRAIQDEYDDRPSLEKDIWDLRKLGLAVNLTDSHYTLNFTLISQLWLRDLAKAFMKYSIATRSPGDSMSKLQSLRRFSQFLVLQYPTSLSSDIDRSMIVQYISYLRTFNLSDRSRKIALGDLRIIFETCAHQLRIEGITREPIIFSS